MRKLRKRVALSVVLALTGCTLSVSAVSAKEQQVENRNDLLSPIISYQFTNGLGEILEADKSAEVVNSETIYVKKSADELTDGEKLDTNGLVYTGEGAEAKYVTVAPVGAPEVVFDTQKGSVLQYSDETIDVSKYEKALSAGITEDNAATVALDKQLRPGDCYYIQGTYEDALETQQIASALKVKNPFSGLAEELKEYEETEDVRTELCNGRLVPVWEKGVTLSYWVKVPVDEAGNYANAGVLRWKNDNGYYYQAGDYAKYLTCKKFDENYAKMTEEQKTEALKKSPSGVFLYLEDGNYVDKDGLLDYYFEYHKDWYQNDADGRIVPVLHTDESGFSGPVYNYAMIDEMNRAGTGRFYYANPNYQNGFYLMPDGSMVKMVHESIYHAGYASLPEVSADAQMTDEKESKVRYGLADGELQIDADNSIFWAPSNEMLVNENSNTEDAGQAMNMQMGNYFTLNSWKGESYASAESVAVSPVTDAQGVKNANAGEWHHVAVTLQNDWIEFYVDGKCVDVAESYSSMGSESIKTAWEFKNFNKGRGLRYSFIKADVSIGNISMDSYVCRLLMDWICDENSELNFGGIGNQAEKYNLSATTSGICIDDVSFYGSLLDAEQIQDIYQDTMMKATVGDVDDNGKFELKDAAMVLKIALGINEMSEKEAKASDINCDNAINLQDANLTLRMALGIE